MFDLVTTMSKYLNMGVSLEEVLSMSTFIPAKILGISTDYGILKKNINANITILKKEKGNFLFKDAIGDERKGTIRLIPSLVIRAGKIYNIIPHGSRNYQKTIN